MPGLYRTYLVAEVGDWVVAVHVTSENNRMTEHVDYM